MDLQLFHFYQRITGFTGNPGLAYLSVAENIGFLLILIGKTALERGGRIDELLDKIRLPGGGAANCRDDEKSWQRI